MPRAMVSPPTATARSGALHAWTGRHGLSAVLSLRLEGEAGAHVAGDLEHPAARGIGPDAAKGHTRPCDELRGHDENRRRREVSRDRHFERRGSGGPMPSGSSCTRGPTVRTGTPSTPSIRSVWSGETDGSLKSVGPPAYRPDSSTALLTSALGLALSYWSAGQAPPGRQRSHDQRSEDSAVVAPLRGPERPR